jgi:vacuolar iron transporter family protein
MQAAEGARRESTAEQANDLRAAVLGFNDGPVANLGLVMGVAGATLSNGAVIVAGLAGLIAGALSMALGEWVSVQSSREMYESGWPRSRWRSTGNRRRRGRSWSRWRRRAAAMRQRARPPPSGCCAIATRRCTRSQATSSASPTATSAARHGAPRRWPSCCSPLARSCRWSRSFFVADHTLAVAASLGLAGLGLFAVGTAITRFTGRSALYSGCRQLAFGGIAALVIYGIGRLFGGELT